MKKITSIILSVIMLLCVIATADVSASAKSVVNMDISVTRNYNYANEVFELVNKERALAGLGKLTMDSSLLETAMLRGAEIVTSFSHTRPDGTACITANSKMVGENIAVGYPTPEDTVNQWMNSSGHRANILNSSYTSIGVGCVKYGSMYYWVQSFGRSAGDGVTKQGTSNVTETINILTLKFNLSFNFSKSNFNAKNYPDGYSVSVVSTNQEFTSTKYTVDPSVLKYSSSNENVFSVNSNGKMIFKGSGTANLKVSLKADDTVYVTKKITVTGLENNSIQSTTSAQNSTSTQKPSTQSPTSTQKPTAPTKPTSPQNSAPVLSLASKSLKAGSAYTVVVSNKGNKIVKYTSSNSSVAKVNSKGKVTALKKGNARITVTVGGTKLYCKIRVTSNPKLSKPSLTVKKGKIKTITISGKAPGVNNKYTNTKRAKVMSKTTAKKIKIKGIRKGASTLKIKVNGVTLKCKVTVK